MYVCVNVTQTITYCTAIEYTVTRIMLRFASLIIDRVNGEDNAIDHVRPSVRFRCSF